MKPLAPNVLIQGRYLIVQLIGKGGMGDVYLAVDQRLGSAVALKRTSFADDETMANAFEREARILANLRHPILPKVSDHFIDEENQFLVMEHITGDDLAKRLEAGGQPFPLSWVLFWADQLLDALHYLHSHEPPIIHRDIKPQNLKLTNDNQIVLLDFGLSKNSLGETRATSSGSIAGYTPHYAPMEQIRGTGTNAQSDIYSLSATLYQLATNVVPPDALTRADSLLSDLPDPIRPIDELNAEVSPDVSKVIVKGMEIRQENRWASAREMQKALRDAFARLQSAMSAQTMAFNVEEGAPDQSDQEIETEPRSSAEVADQPPVSAADAAGIAAGLDSSQPPPPDLGATLSDEPVSEDPGIPPTDDAVAPSEVKTDVLLAGESPEIDAYRETDTTDGQPAADAESVFNTADDFSTGEELPSESFGADEKFSPDATVPLLNFDDAVGADSGVDAGFETSGGPGDTDYFSADANGDDADAVPLFEAPATFVTEPAAAAAPPAVKPTAKKKSGAKTFALVAGLIILFFVFVGAAAGVVWYLTRDAGNAVADPSPSPTVESTPLPSPTLEEIQGNANSAGNDSAGVNSNANSGTAATPVPTREQNQTGPTPATTRSTPTVRPTPKPATPAKPTPKKTSRTDIEQ